MNFNFLSILLLLALMNGCGVKSNPIPPKGTALPDYVDQFLKPTDEPIEEDAQEEE